MIKKAVSICVALGFTVLMAGSNLAHLTARAEGNPVPILGYEIPQWHIMAIMALCVDGGIVVAIMWMEDHARKRAWMKFAVVFAFWVFCSGVSITSMHAWFAAADTKAQSARALDKKKSNTLKANISYERNRLEGVRKALAAGPANDERRALKTQEADAEKAIATYQKSDWEIATTSDVEANPYIPWAAAFGVWFIVSTTWFGFRASQPSHGMGWWDLMGRGMGRGMEWKTKIPWDEKSVTNQRIPSSQNGMESVPRIPGPSQAQNGMESGSHQRPMTLPDGVLDARALLAERSVRRRLSEREAIAVAVARRNQNPPVSWTEIARETGWPVSSINRKWKQSEG